MKKIALIALAALMSLTLLFALAGCGPKDEEVIRDGLAEQLDTFKDPNSTTWTGFSEAEGASLEAIGLNMPDIVAALIDGYSYEIGTITVDGNKATATVTITCKQLVPAVTASSDELNADEMNIGLTEEELYPKYAEAVMRNLTAAQPTTTTLTISFNKNDNIWSEATGAQNSIANAFMGH
jgi:hypothetical protein